MKSRYYTNRKGKGEEAFGVTYNKGYFMNINGYRISVQFGTGNYVDAEVRYGKQENVDPGRWDTAMDFTVWQSNTAEVMIQHTAKSSDNDGGSAIRNTNNFFEPVFGWCSAECVAKFIGCIASAQPGDDITAAINQIYQSNGSND